MTVDIATSLQGRLSDPILMEWALQHYSNAENRDDDYAAELRQRWFDRDSLYHWLDGDDQSLLNRLFVYLPASVFEPLAAEIGQRWPGWSGNLAAHSAPVLANLDPVLAGQLFRTRDGDADIDAETIIGIIDALPDLPLREALTLLKVIATEILETAPADSFGVQTILTRLQSVAMQLNRTIALRVIKARLSGVNLNGDVERIVNGITPGLPAYASLRKLVQEQRSGQTGLRFTDMAALFQPSAPLAELDRLSREARTPLDILPLVGEWVAADDRKLIKLLLEDIPKDQARHSSESLIAISIAAVASAAGLETLTTTDMTLDETLTLLAADLDRVPHRDRLVTRLHEFPREQASPALLEVFARVQREYGGIAMVTIMGTLGWPEFTAPIIAAMSADDGDFLCEEGEIALTRIGESAQVELISRWDGLDSSQRIYGVGVIERIGGDAAVDFALTRFDTLFNDDAENWCAIAESAPDPRLLQRLGPHLQRHQLHIDKCYYIIAKLLGID